MPTERAVEDGFKSTRAELIQQLQYMTRTIETSLLFANGGGLIAVVTIVANTAAIPTRFRLAVSEAYIPGGFFFTGLALAYLYFFPTIAYSTGQLLSLNGAFDAYSSEPKFHSFKRVLKGVLGWSSALLLVASAVLFLAGVAIGAANLLNMAAAGDVAPTSESKSLHPPSQPPPVPLYPRSRAKF